MNKIKLNTTKTQQASSEELDLIAQGLGVQLSLDDTDYGKYSDADVELNVTIKAIGEVYEDTKETLESKGATIIGDSGIRFFDDNVKAICLANYDTDGNGYISYAEAEAVTDTNKFAGNTSIVYFNELKYFKNATINFNGCTALKYIDVAEGVKLSTMAFCYCSSLLLDSSFLSKIDWSSLTSANCMFRGCTNLTEVPDLDLENLTDVGYMFRECFSLKKMGNFITNATNAEGLFYNISSLEEVGDFKVDSAISFPTSLKKIGNMDCSKWTSIINMFNGCSKLASVKSLKVSNLCTNAQAAFSNCSSLDFSFLTKENIDFSNVTNAQNCFWNCTNLTTFPDLGWSSLTSANCMFRGCTSLTEVPDTDWGNLTDVDQMFRECYSLKKMNLSKMNTIATTNINSMFYNNNDNVTSFKVSSSFFNCVTRDDSPVTSFNIISTFTSWVDVDEITNLLNCLPDLVNGGYTATAATIQLSSNTKAVITNNSLASIATNKGWTIA